MSSTSNMSSTSSKYPQHDAEMSILEHIHDMVSVVDKNYIYRAVSHGYEQFFGLKRDAIIGKPAAEIHGQELFEQVIKPALERTLNGEHVHFQFSRPNASQQLRYLDSQHTLYHGPLTEGPGVAVVVRDITEQVLAKRALEHERTLLNTIINAVPDFIFAKDPAGVYQISNQSFADFLGVQVDEILGKTDFELMSYASAEYINGKDQEVRQSLQAQRCDEWVTYKDGRRRLLDMYKLPLFDGHPDNPGVLGIGRNVTHEREAAQKLLMASLVFDAMPDPCLILTQDGLVISSNEAAQCLFPALGDAVSELNITELLSCPDGNTCNLAALLNGSDGWCGEVCTSDNRTLLATINVTDGLSESAKKYVLIIRDEETHRNLAFSLLAKAYQDSLTGLPNRRLFFSRLESAIIRAERQMSSLAILYIDLDNFKPINDQYGHPVGDQALLEIAKKLKSNFRSTDTLARIGGDEFIGLVDVNDPKEAANIAEKVLASLDSDIDLSDEIRVRITASIGISIFPYDGGQAEELVRKADQAMYVAKRSPDKRYSFAVKTAD